VTNPLFDLTGRTALVTGSSRGLGRAMAEGLANAGAKIIVNGTDGARVAKAVDEMRTAGMQAEGLVFDVTDEAAIVRAFADGASPSTSSSTTPASSCASRWWTSPPPNGSA
jgi:gluconate 5-dehydrogenase